MKNRVWFFLLAIWSIALPLSAQTDSLIKDEAYFFQQKDEYQRWLDHTGLGRFIRVHDLHVKEEEGSVHLYLGFYSNNVDTIGSIWRQLKAAHEAQPGLKFEELLLFRMSNLMGLPQQAAVIEVYDTYDNSHASFFFRGIYFKNGRVAVEENNPKGEKNRLINFRLSDIKTRSLSGKTAFPKHYTKAYVFEQICKFAQEKYARSPCEQRKPAIKPKPSEDYLRFDVTDLCREVVKDAQNPTICQWLNRLGYNCNWTTRELLSFTFIYLPTTEGFTLHLTLEGRVGSGYYDHVKRSGYMDMELDFEDELESYVDQIVHDIKKYLTK
ncbi:MAG: hypothetical protein SGI94_05945 [Saprospiraceae bacterium]|nr:hypothetical protein [Saprospiraceae bacterium]